MNTTRRNAGRSRHRHLRVELCEDRLLLDGAANGPTPEATESPSAAEVRQAGEGGFNHLTGDRAVALSANVVLYDYSADQDGFIGGGTAGRLFASDSLNSSGTFQVIIANQLPAPAVEPPIRTPDPHELPPAPGKRTSVLPVETSAAKSVLIDEAPESTPGNSAAEAPGALQSLAVAQASAAGVPVAILQTGGRPAFEGGFASVARIRLVDPTAPIPVAVDAEIDQIAHQREDPAPHSAHALEPDAAFAWVMRVAPTQPTQLAFEVSQAATLPSALRSSAGETQAGAATWLPDTAGQAASTSEAQRQADVESEQPAYAQQERRTKWANATTIVIAAGILMATDQWHYRHTHGERRVTDGQRGVDW